jgi:predicted NUDIX family NTP pyrophosphohydrolase
LCDIYGPMAETSAGVILYRRTGEKPEVLLVHMGGPYWAGKDEAAWSIPKGLTEDGEHPLMAARREFEEETGGTLPTGDFIALGSFPYSSGKKVTAFAVEGDFDLAKFVSGTFAMEWPPRSGQRQHFPEADRAGWFRISEAKRKIVRGQAPILVALEAHLASL